MYHEGGKLYMYLIYGMYWMLNIVVSAREQPQAILIRGVHDINGPGRLTRALQLDRDYYGEDLVTSNRIWIEVKKDSVPFHTTPRININYAGDEWIQKPWRFVINNHLISQV